ncbi:MAG: sporulation integral membrane protein YtvI [Syntrophomonadaceae bacterium]|nr:sporulation integral membrane protein YtvI [Syntrophomonadaceae bacterium]
MDPELNRYIKLLVKLGIFVLILLAVYLLTAYLLPIMGGALAYLPSLLLPFIIALIMAAIIEPLVSWLQRKTRLRRGWAVALSLLFFVGGFFYIISWLIARVIKDLMKMVPLLLSYSDGIAESFLAAVSDLRVLFLELNLPLEVQEALQNSLQQSLKALSSLMSNSIDILTATVSLLPGLFAFIIIAAIATYLISNDRFLIKEFLYRFLPLNTQSKTTSIFKQLVNILLGFLRAYLILISITAGLTMILLQIVGADYVLTIGIVVGFLDMLPILGPGLLFVPWIFIEFMMGHTKLGIALLTIYLFISLVRQFTEPKIIGENIGLHPLITLMALYFGLKLWGGVGLILGPIIVVIIVACYRAGLFESFNWRQDR